MNDNVVDIERRAAVGLIDHMGARRVSYNGAGPYRITSIEEKDDGWWCELIPDKPDYSLDECITARPSKVSLMP